MAIVFLFIFALILRLILAPLGFHIDIFSNAGWGEWIYKNGTLGFYDNNVWLYAWPSQPPFVNLLYAFDNYLYVFLLETFRSIGNNIVRFHLAPGHMIWWFSFTKWFDTAKLTPVSVFSIGYLVSIKLPAILADIFIGLFIYKIAKKVKDVKYSAIWPAIYLVSPFSWYLSALWGQYDQLGFLPLLIAFYLESGKKLPWLTPFLFALSLLVKPTGLILLPFFIYLYFKNKHKIHSLLISLSFIFIFFTGTTLIFTDKNLIYFIAHDLFTKVFLKADTRLSANAFNFWRMFIITGSETQALKVLFIPAYFWSSLAYLLLNIYGCKKIIKLNFKSVISGMFIVGAGSWIFMTNMLDRYFFIGIVSGLILCLYNKKLFKYWVPLSLIFFLNLYNQWWFPDYLQPIKTAFIWQNGLITKVLSAANVLLFLKMLALV